MSMKAIINQQFTAVDNNRLASSGLPILGRIKIGEKAKNSKGVEYPKATDYFICKSPYKGIFTRLFGENPKQLPIRFPSDNPLESCWNRITLRGADGREWATGDGEEWIVFVPFLGFKIRTGEDFDLINVAAQYKSNTKQELSEKIANGLVEQFARKLSVDDIIESCTRGASSVFNTNLQLTMSTELVLRFVIEGFVPTGVFILETRAKASSINNIVGSFHNVRAQMEGVGALQHFDSMPFILMVQMHTSQKPNGKSVYPVIDLHCAVPHIVSNEGVSAFLSEHQRTVDVQAMESIARRTQLTQPNERPQLQSPDS